MINIKHTNKIININRVRNKVLKKVVVSNNNRKEFYRFKESITDNRFDTIFFYISFFLNLSIAEDNMLYSKLHLQTSFR